MEENKNLEVLQENCDNSKQLNLTKKSKKSKILIALLTSFCLIIVFLGGFFTRYFTENKSARLLNEILNIIEKHSIVSENFTSENIADLVVNGTIAPYDDYAQYFSPEEYRTEENNGKGNYNGHGLYVYVADNVIFKTLINSPSYNAGLRKGDRLISGKIEGEQDYSTFIIGDNVNAGDITVTEFFKKTTLNTKVYVKAEQNGVVKEFNFTAKSYKQSYVEYYDNEIMAYYFAEDGNLSLTQYSTDKMSILDKDTAYILLSSFEGDAANQLGGVLRLMKERNKTKLVFDLRDNGGGYMATLCDVAGYLVKGGNQKNPVIAIAKGKSVNESYRVSSKKNVEIEKICVIANQNTASASECLLSAMLYYSDSAKEPFTIDNLILTKNTSRNNFSTYGKGIMQQTFKLFSGGALKLTTAKIYQPDGTTCIHGVGIEQSNTQNCVEDSFALSRATQILGYTT